jgi:quercetin dioxygenase-like cupin family protein
VTGAGAGATLGGLLIGLGVLAVPGIGPIIAAGPLAATLAGVTLGAATGGLIGAFNTLGIPEEDEAHYYAKGVRRGGTVLTVTVADQMVDTVAQVMQWHKAVNIEERVAQWQQSGWKNGHTTPPSTPERSVGQAIQPSLDLDDGGVILKKAQPPFSAATTVATPVIQQKRSGAPPSATAATTPSVPDDTTIIKVNSRYSPRGKRGQKYLASEVKLSMRIWEDEQAAKPKSRTQRDYETVGYVIKECAELRVQGQTVILEPGDSGIVPKGSLHRYKILEPFTAIEATCPPAEVHARDEE